MSEVITSKSEAVSPEKPVEIGEDSVIFPPFPEPGEHDFEDDISDDEKEYYKSKYKDLNLITKEKLHCTACDRHLGCAARKESKMRMHPMLKTLVCHTCHSFYNSGEFDKGEDGSELYCRWCGQGGQVYCCSDCCHVFCAKCIKRNLGMPKIKEIENMDDWKCFKCNCRCLWDLRATCWAVLRYCDLKNKITCTTEDKKLKDLYEKDCGIDYSECCKKKKESRSQKEKEKRKSIKKEKDKDKDKDKEKEKEKEKEKRNSTNISADLISKIPPTIQVKKFASINLEDTPETKSRKRPASPKITSFRSLVSIAPNPTNMYGNIVAIPPPKKYRTSSPNVLRQNIRPVNQTYRQYRPRASVINPLSMQRPQYNGYGGMSSMGPNMSNLGINYNPFNAFGDNINLSLDNLTQGLDMAAVAAMANNQPSQDQLVCTPDFPIEPLCEVTEDNNDDDVECITPAAPTKSNPQRNTPMIPEITSDNIVQMTEDDVTVNSVTGGLKFRVDPQTLSSNKMYRLPDGRIFAINANPNMPGGYSATIVAVTENKTGKPAPKGATYAAKVNAVTKTPSPPPLASKNKSNRSMLKSKLGEKNSKRSSKNNSPPRNCDMNVPIEWYRYNLIDAIDALDYSVNRLQKLKKEATTMYLRTRSLPEMRTLHKSLENLLKTSKSRFEEIRVNLNKGFKQYLSQKQSGNKVTELSDDDDKRNDDDDDDVEILDANDDPIFIDENSLDSNANDNGEVDLTVTNSDHNDSGEKAASKDPLDGNDLDSNFEHIDKNKDQTKDTSIMEVDDADESGEKSKEKDSHETDKDKSAGDHNKSDPKESEKHTESDADKPDEKHESDTEDKQDLENEVESKDITENNDNIDNKDEDDTQIPSEPQKDITENGEDEETKEGDIKDRKLSDNEKCEDKKSGDEKSDDEQETKETCDNDEKSGDEKSDNEQETKETGDNNSISNKKESVETHKSKDLEENLNLDENDSKQEVEMTDDLIDSLLKDDEGADMQNIDSIEPSEILG